jgi:hypothetical protein
VNALWQGFLKWGDSALVALAGFLSTPTGAALAAAVLGKLGPYAPVVLALLALAHINLLPEPSKSLPPPAAGVVRVLVTFLVLASVGALFGCSLLSSPAGQTVELAAVDSAVAIAESKGVPAATINAVAELALTGDAVATGILGSMLSKANPSLTEAEAQLTAALQRAAADTTAPPATAAPAAAGGY